MKYTTYAENLNFVLGHSIRCTADEAETIINTNRTDPLAYIDTSDNVTLTRVKKLLVKDATNWKLVNYTVSSADPEFMTSVVVTCPKKLIRFAAQPAKREYTEEEKAALRENIRKAHEARRAKINSAV